MVMQYISVCHYYLLRYNLLDSPYYESFSELKSSVLLVTINIIYNQLKVVVFLSHCHYYFC